MPYRIDILSPPPDAFDLLVQLGALDIELTNAGIAAIMPDDVAHQTVAAALKVSSVRVSNAVDRDNGSVWLLSPGTVRIGNLVIAPPGATDSDKTMRLNDSPVFGTGHHATTAMCVEALEESLTCQPIESALDVGTGSGILALAALMMGVPHAVGLDTDKEALRMAAENARLNHLDHRLQLVHGGPAIVDGQWPLVMANVLAAPLIDMASLITRRVSRRGRLILSGIPYSLEADVTRAYQHTGMHHVRSNTRTGWTMVVMQASY